MILRTTDTTEDTTDDTSTDTTIRQMILTQIHQMIEPQNTAGHVSPPQKVTGQQKSIFWLKRPKFIASLPLTRQLDLLAFVMYHFVYVLFNLIYWTRLMISDKI